MRNLVYFADVELLTPKRKIDVLPKRKLVREVKSLNKRIKRVAFLTGCDLSVANTVVLSKLQK